MGQRGNYILKSSDSTKIYYTHWRANKIACDLLLGSQTFISFIKEFDLHDELLDEPWIEGAVYVDLENKEILFWEMELLPNYSVRETYMKELKNIWKGWNVEYAEKAMYDIETKLNIAYSDRQEVELSQIELDQIKDDKPEEYTSCQVLLKTKKEFGIINHYKGNEEQIAQLGNC
ncbi:hypothetical protein V6R21_03480 [Limibacter armeniacum]|uniref:hypothetical protein n=1 Tax=Limibacter armeniacum TaxID=466084 RepID=UPI002FE598D5